MVVEQHIRNVVDMNEIQHAMEKVPLKPSLLSARWKKNT
jgi:hypothetical protein